MKIIKLFFLLTFGLWSEFKIDISNEVNTEQLQYIVENGWSDKNETLNKFIIKYGEKVFPDILKKIQKPTIKVEPTKENLSSIPTILLSRDDYKFIFSYLKYLEFKGEVSKAEEGYLSALKGLSTIKDRSIISVIYRLMIEKMIVSSLSQAIHAKRFSSQQIKEIKNAAEQYLLEDNKILWSAFQYEVEGSDQLLRRGLGLDITELEKSNLVKIADINHKLNVDLYKQCWDLKTIEAQEIYIHDINNQREKFLGEHKKDISEFQLLTWDYIGSQYAKQWKDGKGSSQEDKKFVKSISNANALKQVDVNVEVGAKWLFYVAASPKFYIQLKRDIDNQIVKNKELIKTL